MAIAFRSSNVSTSGASPRTVTKPTGTADGDLLILQVSSSGADVTPTPPTDFVEIVGARNTTVPTLRVYIKTAGASEPADYSVTFPSGSGHTLGMMAVTPDAGQVLTEDDSANQANGAGDRICPSVTTTEADTFLVCFAALGNIGSIADGAMTERWDSGSSPRIYAMTQNLAASGATGTRTATGTAAANETATIAFRQDASSDLTPPSDLSATPVDTDEITLDWTNTASGHDGWKIERSPAGAGTWTQIDSIDPSLSAYAAIGLSANTAYDFRVRAYDGAVNGDYSNTASATTYPVLTAPYSLSATPQGTTRILLAWEDDNALANIDGFSIERSLLPSSNFSEIDTVADNVASYLDEGLSAGTLYYYRVRAFKT